MNIFELCDQVRGISYDIHVYHGHGHLEKIYENALAHRLRKAGFNVHQQKPINVYDEDGTLLGEYDADLVHIFVNTVTYGNGMPVTVGRLR